MSVTYCNRCERSFRTIDSLEQHQNDSQRHNICEACPFDAGSYRDLIDHYQSTGHRIVCGGCPIGKDIWVPGSREHLNHLVAENVCPTCDRHFQNDNNLKQHSIVHREKNISCYGCVRTFRSYSGMIIHLESGACTSGIDRDDLNRSAGLCYQWKHFMKKWFRDRLFNDDDDDDVYEDSGDEGYPFDCPSCSSEFQKLSALFQHVDSTSCNQTLANGSIGKLVRWLRNRHG